MSETPVRWIYVHGDDPSETVPGIYANVPDLLALIAEHDLEYVRYGLQETLDSALSAAGPIDA